MAIFSQAEKKKFKKVKEADCLFTVGVEIGADEVASASQTALVQIQSRARLPGFRPGKAPLKMVEAQFSADAAQRVVDEFIRKALPEVLKEFDLKPVASPTVHDIDFAKGKPLSFQLTFETAPKFEPKDYKKLALNAEKAPSADKAAEERLAEIRESNARLEKAQEDAIGKDHYVVVDYEATLDGKPLAGGKAENELIDMSAPQSVEGLCEGLLGAKRGEQREVKVQLEKKPGVFKVTVKEIKRKVVPPLDEELSKDLGFATLEELKSRVKEVVVKEQEDKAEKSMREQIDQKLVDSNPIALPPSVVEAQARSLLDRIKGQWTRSGRQWPTKDDSEFQGRLKAEAEKQVRLSYVIQGISAKEGLEASDDDVAKELAANVERAASPEEKENLKKFFEEHRGEVASVIRERKVYEFIKQNAKIKES